MNISRRFIEYPVMTTLLMAALVIFGIFGYAALPVSELPNVDFPTIQVNASLAGADPITMKGIKSGEFCGRCHGPVAFGTTGDDCDRCHPS